MLIVVLVAAVVLYGAIYVFYSMLEPHVASSSGPVITVLNALREATLMPQGTVFVILRGLILVTLLYVVTEWLLSTVKSGVLRRQRERQREREWKAVGMDAPKPRSRNPFVARRQAQRELRDRIEAGVNTRS